MEELREKEYQRELASETEEDKKKGEDDIKGKEKGAESPKRNRPPVPERVARRALAVSGPKKTYFATFVMRNATRVRCNYRQMQSDLKLQVAFRLMGMEEYMCNDNGKLAATYNHQNGLTCFSSKKELFEIEWYGNQCALVNYYPKTRYSSLS